MRALIISAALLSGCSLTAEQPFEGFFIRVEGGYQPIREAAPSGLYWPYDRNEGSPFIAALSMGWQYEMNSQWSGSFYCRHASMPSIADKGEDGCWKEVTYTPFRRN